MGIKKRGRKGSGNGGKPKGKDKANTKPRPKPNADVKTKGKGDIKAKVSDEVQKNGHKDAEADLLNLSSSSTASTISSINDEVIISMTETDI